MNKSYLLGPLCACVIVCAQGNAAETVAFNASTVSGHYAPTQITSSVITQTKRDRSDSLVAFLEIAGFAGLMIGCGLMGVLLLRKANRH